MVLEEKLSFDTREDANLFQKFLREKGCSSRIAVEHTFSCEPFFEGSVADFMTLIALLEKKDAEEGEADEELSFTKKDLENRRDTLNEFFASHKPGDILEDSTPTQMMARVQSIGAESDEAFRKEAADKFVASLMILGALEDNNLLEETEDGNSYTLTGTAKAEDLRVMYPYTDFPKISAEELKECCISSHINVVSYEKHVVTAGAEIIFVDTDELTDYLDNADADEDDSARFIDNVFFKQAFIAKVHDLIANGASSEAELVKSLENPAFPLEGTDDVISFDVSSEYLAGVLSDLRKLEVISGKDGKIKNL